MSVLLEANPCSAKTVKAKTSIEKWHKWEASEAHAKVIKSIPGELQERGKLTSKKGCEKELCKDTMEVTQGT